MKFTRIGGGQVLLLLGLVIAWFCVGSADVLNASSVSYKPELTQFERGQLPLLSRTLDEYAAIKGRFPHLADLEAEGYLFFDLKNPVTGERLSESCERAVPGAICIRLSDPYTFESLWDYDREGNPRILLYLKSGRPWRVIPEDEREQTRWFSLYRVGKQKGYSEAELKLVMLGAILSSRLGFWPDIFRQEPLNVIIDPITGERLTYSDGGFGERVRITPAGQEGGQVQLRVMLDGKVVYAAETYRIGPKQTAYGFRMGGTGVLYLPPLGRGKMDPELEELP